MSSKKSALIILIVFNLLQLNICDAYKYRYVDESDEIDRNFMFNSIKHNVRNFTPRFDLKVPKHQRQDTFSLNENFFDNYLKPLPTRHDKLLQYNSEQIEDTLTENLMSLNEQINHSTNTRKPILNSSTLSYKLNISNNLDRFPPKLPELNIKKLQQNDFDSTGQAQMEGASTATTEKHPIYFTNPLTGIVYAITEVGFNYSKLSHGDVAASNSSSSIPIYIPKEQYDRDMNLLKSEMTKQCQNGKNLNNQTKPAAIQLSNTKVPIIMKPVKIKKKKKIKKVKPLKQSGHQTQQIQVQHHHTSKENDANDNSDSFDEFDGVLNDVFEVIDDSTSSSEEVRQPIVTKRKQKKLNIKRKVKLKNKIEIKPTITSTIMKNGNNATKLSEPIFQTQVEPPNKIPNRGMTTVQTFVSSYPVQQHQTHPSNVFSRLNHHVAKRSINNSTNVSVNNTTLANTVQSNSTTASVVKRTNRLPSFMEKKQIRKATGHKLKGNKSTTAKRQFSTAHSSSTANYYKTIIKTPKPAYIYYVEENGIDETKQPGTPILFLSELHYGPKKSTPTVSPSTTPMTPPQPPCKKSKKPNYDNDFNEEEEDDDDDDDDYPDYPDFSYDNDDDDDDDDGGDDDDDDDDNDKNTKINYSQYDADKNSGQEISETNNEVGDSQDIVQRTRKNIEKKRNRKRKPNYDNDDDDDDSDSNGIVLIANFFRILFYPAQSVFEKILSKAGFFGGLNNRIDEDDQNNDDNEFVSFVASDTRHPKFPKYTVYNSDGTENVESNSWFGTWFSGIDGKDNGKKPIAGQSGWFDSWFESNEEITTTTPSNEDYDDDDGEDGYWFFNWFDSQKKRKTSTPEATTTATTPILTIANPMKNPQKWIGILAQHIVNSTTTPNAIPVASVEENEPTIVSYDKYQIWRLKPFGEYQLRALIRYKNSEEGLNMQWLQGPSLKGLNDVLVPPKLQTNFQGTLNYENIAHEVLIFDVGKVIYYETKENARTNSSSNVSSNWNRYHNYDRIIRFIETLQIQNPKFVELFHIGRSYEGRPLIIVKIGIKDSNNANFKKKLKLKQKQNGRNNGVFIESGVHGREWITPAVSIWIINELVKIMKNNRTTAETDFIKKTNWYIMPMLNPDGYEYSQEYDRMWKKSRSKNLYKSNGLIESAMTWLQQQKRTDKICYGVDIDQNWENDWSGFGSSPMPCNEFFAGPQSFSEPETRILSKFIMDHRTKIKLFVSLQSYGQVITYPNKLNSSVSSHKLDDLLDVAMVGNEALRKSGSTARYKIDSTNDLIVIKSGTSTQFAMYEAGIPFCYTFHLGDNGVHGYLLPGSYIEPTARDAFEMIKAIVDYI